MKMMKYDTKTEFFECDCHDRDDLIIAKRSLYIYDNPVHNDMDVSLEMVTSDGDWERDYKYNNMITRFLGRLWWRIKKAASILVTGKIIRHGYWMPARLDFSTHQMVGTEETRRLGQFLIESADKIDEFYNVSNSKKEDICQQDTPQQ